MGVFASQPIGSEDENRPYKGYKLCYGSMTLADIQSKGFIPLSVWVRYGVGTQGRYKAQHGRLQINGVDTNFYTAHTIDAMNDYGNFTPYTDFYVDLDTEYSGDLEKCKAVGANSITARNSFNSYATLVIGTCRRWLEPIEE